MPEISRTTTTRLLSKVSSMYYDQSYNQQEIANRLHLSRPKVSRLLKEAREKGIVKISVISQDNSFVNLENELESKYRLKEALITEIDPQSSPEVIKRQLGVAAANYLHRAVSKGDVIGVSWGTTLQAMINAMIPKPMGGTHIVQALGGVGPPEAKTHAADISRRLSGLLESRLTLLPAPGIVDSNETKEVLLNGRRIRNALNLFSEINMLLVGLGTMSTNPVLDQENEEIPPALLQEIVNSDAVGDIALHFFDIEGNEINSKLKDLLIGISTEEIRKIDTVVGIAGGIEKTDAIQGALNGNLINLLITDNYTAERLL
jgi:DNA-binding transcriptional regulator LsrR (DeoR family)